MTERRLRILESFQEPRATTNPYITQLLDALRTRAEVDTFGWRRALSDHYDVFHVHWPEVMLASPSLIKRAARRACFLFMLTRMQRRSTAIVRTIHNLEPHDQVAGIDRWLLRRLDRQTVGWIRINSRTPLPAAASTATILHGHYRDWFPPDSPARVPGRLVFVGQIRPYKGVAELLETFRELRDESASLEVLGKPNSPELAAQVQEAAAGDGRIALTLRHATDIELATAVRQSVAVVLPYREMHNSGSALVAVSLGTRVLVPMTQINDDLADEIGPEWVLRYEGELTPEVLGAAIATPVPDGTPDLARREWGGAAAAHIALFRDVVAHDGAAESA